MRDPGMTPSFPLSTYSIHESFFPFAVHITFRILFDLFKKNSIEEQDEKNEGSRNDASLPSFPLSTYSIH